MHRGLFKLKFAGKNSTSAGSSQNAGDEDNPLRFIVGGGMIITDYLRNPSTAFHQKGSNPSPARLHQLHRSIFVQTQNSPSNKIFSAIGLSTMQLFHKKENIMLNDQRQELGINMQGEMRGGKNLDSKLAKISHKHTFITL